MLALFSRRSSVLATLVIRNVEDALHNRLKRQAAAHGRSMEEEARLILRDRLTAASEEPEASWVDAIRALFEPLGGLELPEIERQPPREPPDLSGPEWHPNFKP
jgi:plasmid stability protein